MAPPESSPASSTGRPWEISRLAATPDFPFDPDLLRHISPIEWKNVVLLIRTRVTVCVIAGMVARDGCSRCDTALPTCDGTMAAWRMSRRATCW